MENGFLKEKYNLHNAPEVENAVERTEARTGKKVPKNPEARIENYLDRLERLALDPEKKQERKMFRDEPRPRALSLLREMVMNKYVRPNKEKMAEGAARVEERAAREMGIEAHYGEAELEQRGEIAVEDLEKSLDNWISYLSDANEPHPTWFRYYAFRNILDLGDYDKDKGEFTKRSQGSTRLFPDIDRGALAYVEQMIEAAKDPAMLERLRKAEETVGTPRDQLLTKEKAAEFAKMQFAKQYAEGIKAAGEITPEMREESRGRWVKYGKGTDPTALWASLQNKGVAWCTKGFATAETQLKGGDFYVYYSYDRQGKPTVPRIAIRMQEEQIGEVRGVADNNQNLEGNMAAIAEEKMKELPGAERYKKASADMKALTAIEKKTSHGERLGKEDLIFLYEINQPIEGFGYQKDPRIKELLSQRNSIEDILVIYGYDLRAEKPGKEALEFMYGEFMYGAARLVPAPFIDKIRELRAQRDPEEDMPVIFECDKNQIARNASEIKENTKVYVGPIAREWANTETGKTELMPEYHNIFQKLANLEHIYTSFPEGKIRETIEIGGKDAKTLVKEMKERKINILDYVMDMLKSKDFTVLKETESEILIHLKVGDLGFPKNKHPTTEKVYERIEELGLELCPPETGPQYCLQCANQPMDEWFCIGMKQIAGRDGLPSVFRLARRGDGLWLSGDWAPPDHEWPPAHGFVFRLRKPR